MPRKLATALPVTPVRPTRSKADRVSTSADHGDEYKYILIIYTIHVHVHPQIAMIKYFFFLLLLLLSCLSEEEESFEAVQAKETRHGHHRVSEEIARTSSPMLSKMNGSYS